MCMESTGKLFIFVICCCSILLSSFFPHHILTKDGKAYKKWKRTSHTDMIWHKIWILCKFLSFLNAFRVSTFRYIRIRQTTFVGAHRRLFILLQLGIITRKQTSIKLHLKALTIFMAQLPFAVPFFFSFCYSLYLSDPIFLY